MTRRRGHPFIWTFAVLFTASAVADGAWMAAVLGAALALWLLFI